MTETNIFPKSILVKSQPKKNKTYQNADGSKLRVIMRYDDNCGNGHNSFSITGDWWKNGIETRTPDAGGCIHDIIKQYVPELAKYIKWHLCTSEGPSAYISNAIYCAGNRDYNGHTRGNISTYMYGIRFNGSTVTHIIESNLWDYLKHAIENDITEFKLTAFEHVNRPNENYDFGPHYSINNFANSWYDAPFQNSITNAQELCNGLMNETIEFVKLPKTYSKGKPRDFDSARYHAVWPEATDEQLSLPKEELELLLKARLPALMKEFKATVEELGFTY